jgi:ubiquinone/menaquinone biosynthesis C-methylase UbiE
MSTPEMIQDEWARWLLHRRHGGDPETQKAMLADLYQVRDKVLAHAQVAAGDVLLDVGAGDGLIAFGAVPLVGEHGRVISSDISHDLLHHCQALADQLGVRDRCTFLHASADDLSALEDASVDVVTTRSVLIYVVAKQQVFQEFYRVLKPGGRLSIYEPINRFATGGRPFDVRPIQAVADKIQAVYELLQPRESDPMLNFDERDLLTWVEQAGFDEAHLELRADIAPCQPERWEVALHRSGNPKIPTLAEAMQEALTPAEAEQFIAYVRPRIERGEGTRRMATAYLWAVKSRT